MSSMKAILAVVPTDPAHAVSADDVARALSSASSIAKRAVVARQIGKLVKRGALVKIGGAWCGRSSRCLRGAHDAH